MLCQLSYRGSLLSDRHHSNRERWSLNQFGPRLLQRLAGERAHAGVIGVESLVVLHEPANLAPGGCPAGDHVEPLAPAYDGASLEDDRRGHALAHQLQQPTWLVEHEP